MVCRSIALFVRVLLIKTVLIAGVSRADLLAYEPLYLFYGESFGEVVLGGMESGSYLGDFNHPLTLLTIEPQIQTLFRRGNMWKTPLEDGSLDRLVSHALVVNSVTPISAIRNTRVAFSAQRLLLGYRYDSFKDTDFEATLSGGRQDNAFSTLLVTAPTNKFQIGVGVISQIETNVFFSWQYRPFTHFKFGQRRYMEDFSVWGKAGISLQNAAAREQAICTETITGLTEWLLELVLGEVCTAAEPLSAEEMLRRDQHYLDFALNSKNRMRNEWRLWFGKEKGSYLEIDIEGSNPLKRNQWRWQWNVYDQWKLVTYYRHRYENFLEPITMDDRAERGQAQGSWEMEHWNMYLEFPRRQSIWRLGVLGVRQKVDLGGYVNVGNVVGNVIGGQFRADADLQLSGFQVHFGSIWQRSTTTELSAGLRYMDIHPLMNIRYWESPQTGDSLSFLNSLDSFLGSIGDRENITSPYDRVQVGAISFGFHYRLGQWGVRYAVAQLFPLSLTKRPSDEVPEEETTLVSDRSLWDMLLDSGGNMQRLMVSWYF
jgi:hypothetical protein